MPSLKRHDGELMVDHRASPGLTEDQARAMDLPEVQFFGEGQMYVGPTLGCNHCGAAVVLHPQRERPRAYCRLCDHYICDWCDEARAEPDYVHWTIQGLIDAVMSGKYVLAPGPASRPKLIPVGALHV